LDGIGAGGRPERLPRRGGEATDRAHWSACMRLQYYANRQEGNQQEFPFSIWRSETGIIRRDSRTPIFPYLSGPFEKPGVT
jgi:hypothetical protein